MIVEKVTDYHDVIRKIERFWTLLTSVERQFVLSSICVQSYKKNERIYNEGQNADFLYGLLSGKVKICRDGVGGRSQIIRVLRPVQYFGYRAALANEPYATAAAALEPTTLCSIPMEAIRKILESNNSFCRFLIHELAVDLGIADRRTVSLTQKHIRGRLAESLLFLKETYGLDPEDESLGIRLSREDLANLSNMTTANAIRTLSTFAMEGLLTIDGRKIRIINEDQLKRISQIG